MVSDDSRTKNRGKKGTRGGMEHKGVDGETPTQIGCQDFVQTAVVGATGWMEDTRGKIQGVSIEASVRGREPRLGA